MTDVKTEGQHQGEFVIRVVDADEGSTLSFDKGTLKSGESVVDGQVLALSAGKLIAAVGSVDSAGDSDEGIVGLAFGDKDASSGDVEMTYVSRLAEVDVTNEKVHFPTTSDQATTDAALKAALKALFIISR